MPQAKALLHRRRQVQHLKPEALANAAGMRAAITGRCSHKASHYVTLSIHTSVLPATLTVPTAPPPAAAAAAAGVRPHNLGTD